MYRVEIRIHSYSPLHIGGSSPAGTSAMKGIVKDAFGWPYIPASTFKGRLRHNMEKISSLFGKRACNTHRQMCQDLISACPACQLFGSAWIPGTLEISDFHLVEPRVYASKTNGGTATNPPPSSHRYGVGISRTRKVSSDQLLYTLEMISPGIEFVFQGEIKGEITFTQLMWIYASLRFMDSIGGGRTRGLGWIGSQTTIWDENDQKVDEKKLLDSLEGIL